MHFLLQIIGKTIASVIVAGCLDIVGHYETRPDQTAQFKSYTRIVEDVDIEQPEPPLATYYDMDDEELELLARVVQAEAGNQGLYGKQLVVDVIFNRVDSSKFPNTVEGVCSQSGQFSVYASGAIYRVEPDIETYQAICLELDNRENDFILYFNNSGFGKNPWKKVGDHYFSY